MKDTVQFYNRFKEDGSIKETIKEVCDGKSLIRTNITAGKIILAIAK